MVDALERPQRSRASKAAMPRPRNDDLGLTFAVGAADAARLDAYRKLCRSANFSPSQSPDWVEAWTGNVAGDHLVALAYENGKPVLGLALDIAQRGPFRMAGFMGGRHANGNHLPVGREAAPSPRQIAGLFGAIAAARPDIDVLALERQAPALAQRDNPLIALAASESPNPALAVSLGGGFECVLSRLNGKRKRKKHRSQLRKFEAAGGFECARADTPDDVARMLEAFFAMRAERFRKIGAADTFAAPGVRGFFASLFVNALREPEPSFYLQGLTVGGKLRAVAGMSESGERLVCDFCAFAEDELTSASPGDFLFFETIRDACERRLEIFDFSVGDEVYKRQWCDIESRQFDSYCPLTAKGRLAVRLSAAGGRVKRTVKSNPVLWRLAKRLRKLSAGRSKATPAADAED